MSALRTLAPRHQVPGYPCAATRAHPDSHPTCPSTHRTPPPPPPHPRKSTETRCSRSQEPASCYGVAFPPNFMLAYFTAPMVRPRTSQRCATQPAIKTGAMARVEAADILAQNNPSLVMKPEM